MEIVGSAIVFLLGIILVVKGGDIFVEAAGGLARGLGLPTFLVGATVVSLATTLPEIMVSVLAAFQGKVEMAVGNALGSVTANTALTLATGMIVLPNIGLGRGIRIPCLLLLFAIGGLWTVCSGGVPAMAGYLFLVAICGLFLWYNLRHAVRDKVENSVSSVGNWVWKFLLGAAGIVAGSQFLISGGEGLARILGASERVIAITLMAIGTSLPELVTTLAAIKKGEAALSVGNVIGANIIDLTLIIPLCAFAAGEALPISQQNLLCDFPLCAIVLAVATIPFMLWKKSSRLQGIVLWLLYGSYLLSIGA